MKILITGTNGLLGQKLIEKSGDHVDLRILATSKGLCRFKLHSDNHQYASMDIVDIKEVFSVCENFRPDAVINTAAITQVDYCHEHPEICKEVNFTGVENLIKAAQKNNFHLIHLSTDFIFDGKDGPYNENDIPNPVSYYGNTKLDAEQAILGSEISNTIIRTILVYGVTPNMSRSNIVLWVKESLEKNKIIKVVDDQFRTPTLVDDLAEACLHIAKGKLQGIFNIGGPEMLTPYQMAIQTARHFNLDVSLIQKVNADVFSQPAMRPPKTGLEIMKAGKVFGYSPHNFSQGIAILEKQLNQI